MCRADGGLAAAAVHAFVRAELELAGCVVAGVAHRTASLEDRADLGHIAQWLRGGHHRNGRAQVLHTGNDGEQKNTLDAADTDVVRVTLRFL